MKDFIVDDDDIENEVSDPDQLKQLKRLQQRNKFVYYNDDESESDYDMEAGYDEIDEEERRAARIARKEDAEALKQIQEDERQERLERKIKRTRN